MLARDFIEDSLYNPNYGYFSKQAVILSPPQKPDIPALRDNAAFQSLLNETYAEFDALIDDEGDPMAPRQVWQTPTEMFRPHYGQAIARYLVTHYKLSHYPYADLVIYEVGAGNGTLMSDILDFLRLEEPQVYEKTRYRIIEISSRLAARQAASLETRAEGGGHAGKVEIVNKSIFDMDVDVPGPCFFLAMEVLDNLAHDAIRYDLVTGRPYQALVAIDETGEFHEILDPQLDPLASRFLALRHKTCGPSLHPALKVPAMLRRFKSDLPFTANLSTPEFIPTKALALLDVLGKRFPQHRMLAADFTTLTEAMEGINAPVVQTRYKGTMVPCSTYMVMPGYFDIMFPTNWDTLKHIYSHLIRPTVKVASHADFLSEWADLEKTTTRSGENPMIDFYQNASFFRS